MFYPIRIHKKICPPKNNWPVDPLSVVVWAERVDLTGTWRPRRPRQCQMALTVKSSHLLNFQKKNTENWRERVLKYILLFRLPPTAESAWTPSSSPFQTILVKCLHFRLTTFYFRSAFTWKGGSSFMLLADRSITLGASFMGADPKYLEIVEIFSSSQTQLFDWRILKIFDRSTKEPVEAFLRQIASIEVKIAYYPLLFTAWVWDTIMTTSGYLEHYLDSLESLPGEVRRNFTLMCDLDTKNKNILQVGRITTTYYI